MKKTEKLIKKNNHPREGNKLNDSTVPYNSLKRISQLKDFTYSEFKKISDKAPFTQAEWSSMLHVSERTLQRYAKSNGSFASINAERALQIEKVLREAKIAFGNTDNFYNWLKQKPTIPDGDLSIESLNSLDGIERIITQLGRIQHGLFA